MKNVLVTGANGQLGKCIKDISSCYPDLHFLFTDLKELNIADRDSVREFFSKNNLDYCINAAAYTNVEKAESEKDQAFQVNAEGTKNLALECRSRKIVIIQISTDYVFDGNKKSPYKETDDTGPLNVYGASKLKGEEYIEEICEEYFIVRTSWLYSQYGHNFFKTISNKIKESATLTITTEQIGTPTNANDLTRAILDMVKSDSRYYGIYHYSNSGEATWHSFAEAIIKYSNQLDKTNLEKTNHYRTFATRPKYSVLDNNKFFKTFNVTPREWTESVQSLIKKCNY